MKITLTFPILSIGAYIKIYQSFFFCPYANLLYGSLIANVHAIFYELIQTSLPSHHPLEP